MSLIFFLHGSRCLNLQDLFLMMEQLLDLLVNFAELHAVPFFGATHLLEWKLMGLIVVEWGFFFAARGACFVKE